MRDVISAGLSSSRHSVSSPSLWGLGHASRTKSALVGDQSQRVSGFVDR
jgi:hypothetical protein